jgi:hypothetical protein
MHALSNDSKRKIHGTHQDRGGKARCQFFGAAFARPEFARMLDKFTRARSQDLWRANFLVPIQTPAKSYGLINFWYRVSFGCHPNAPEKNMTGWGHDADMSQVQWSIQLVFASPSLHLRFILRGPMHLTKLFGPYSILLSTRTKKQKSKLGSV